MKLSAKHRVFVNEYIKSRNATDAARKAGYSKKAAKTTGPRLLANAGVAAAIEKALVRATEKAELTVADVLAEMRRVAFFDLSKVFSEDGALKPIHEMDEETRRIVASIETDELYAGRGSKRELIGYSRKVKIADKMKALEMIGRHFKMFTDKVEHTGKDGGPQVVLTMPADGSEADAE